MNIYAIKETDIVYSAAVDFGTRTCSEEVHIVQYDNSLPIVAVKLYSSGDYFKLPTGYEANLRFSKKDKTFIYKPVLGCDETRTIVYFIVDEQMSLIAGDVYPIIELTYGGSVVGSSPIIFIIDKNPIQIGDIESKSDYPAIVERISSAETKASEAEIKAAEAKVSADDARDKMSKIDDTYAKNENVSKTYATKTERSDGDSQTLSQAKTYTNEAVKSVVNVQSDWAVTDTSSDAYIKNKPSFVANNPTLSGGKTSTIGTAGGITYNVTLASNPIESFTLPFHRPVVNGGDGKQWSRIAKIEYASTSQRWAYHTAVIQFYTNGYGSNQKFTYLGQVSIGITIQNREDLTKEDAAVKWRDCKPSQYAASKIKAVVTATTVEFFILNDIWDTGILCKIMYKNGLNPTYDSTYTYTADEFTEYCADKNVINGEIDTNFKIGSSITADYATNIGSSSKSYTMNDLVLSQNEPKYADIQTSYVGGVVRGPRGYDWEYLIRAEHRNGQSDGSGYVLEIAGYYWAKIYPGLWWRQTNGGTSSWTSWYRIYDDDYHPYTNALGTSSANYTYATLQSALDGKASSVHTHTKSAITDFPTKLSQFTNDSGFTTNTGTVTGIKMNGTTKSPASGVVDLGTVITSHQSLASYATKTYVDDSTSNAVDEAEQYTNTNLNNYYNKAASSNVFAEGPYVFVKVLDSGSSVNSTLVPDINMGIVESSVTAKVTAKSVLWRNTVDNTYKITMDLYCSSLSPSCTLKPKKIGLTKLTSYASAWRIPAVDTLYSCPTASNQLISWGINNWWVSNLTGCAFTDMATNIGLLNGDGWGSPSILGKGTNGDLAVAYTFIEADTDHISDNLSVYGFRYHIEIITAKTTL
jgi:hypothetical protein